MHVCWFVGWGGCLEEEVGEEPELLYLATALAPEEGTVVWCLGEGRWTIVNKVGTNSLWGH